MVLADDVRDVKGRLLLTKGKPIGSEHIRIFKIWGIPRVQILGAQGENEPLAAPPVDPGRLEAVRKETEFVFRYTDRDHPAIREIFTLAVNHRAAAPPQTADSLPVEIPVAEQSPQHSDFLQKFIEKDIVLPEIPSIVFELNEVIANPLSSADQMAQVINRSPSLTALLLKIVNSSFYGLPSKVDRVSLAVTLIGTRELSALALGISIMSIFRKIPSRLLSMPLFLQHSLACGIVSRLLAAQKNMRQTEQMFTAGLLHDLGRLVTCIYFPDEALAAMRHAATKSICLHAAEKDLFSCHHGHVGKYILNQWRLPLILENNVCFHHDPMNAPDPAAAALVHVADLLVNALGVGTSGERFVPPLDLGAWEATGLSADCLEMVSTQAVNQINTLEILLQA
ncbi:MAG TPA: HDOD domain-containing protein [Desulfobacterales bacterium]|nr:HDOD domain-containing protein [Desulfobacterales bacterium]